MKSRTITSLLSIIMMMGFANIVLAQDYSYLLTVTSLGEEEQHFNVEIKSIDASSAEVTTRTLSDQLTPFEMSLAVSEHRIVVEKGKELGHIESKMMSMLNGKMGASASCNDHKALLTAWPGGRFSATKYGS